MRCSDVFYMVHVAFIIVTLQHLWTYVTQSTLSHAPQYTDEHGGCDRRGSTVNFGGDIFARKYMYENEIPEFCMIVARNFFTIFGLGGGARAPLHCPCLLYA